MSNFHYGFFVNIGAFSNTSFTIGGKYSRAFNVVVALAKKINCDYICFDRDADLIPGFPIFNW